MQPPQEVHPERLRFRGANAGTDDLSAPVCIGSNGDYRGHRDDPAALPGPKAGGVEPQIGPLACERAVEEPVDPLIDVLAKPGHCAPGHAGNAHGLHRIIHLAGGHATDPGLLHKGDQRLPRDFARLRKSGEVAAMAQLGNLEVQCAHTGIERTLSIPVPPGRAPGRAIVSPFMPSCTDQAFHIGLHDQMKNVPGRHTHKVALKVALIVLGQKPGKVHAGPGHRGLRSVAAEAERIGDAICEQVLRTLRRRGAAVGLSGGIDSSVTAALCVEALGPKKVVAILMPEKDSDDESLTLEKMVADKLGIEYVTEDIEPILTAAGCYGRRDDFIHRIVPEFGPGWGCKIVLTNALEGRGTNLSSLVVESPQGERRKIRMPLDVYQGVVAAANMKQRTRKQLEYFHADRLNLCRLRHAEPA